MEVILFFLVFLGIGIVLNLLKAGARSLATGESFGESLTGFAELQMRLVDNTLKHEMRQPEVYKSVEIKGSLAFGFGMDLEVVTKIYDVTDDGQHKFVLSGVDSMQEGSTVVYEQRTSLGLIAHDVGFKNWVEIARVFPNFIEPCRSGSRKIKVSVFVAKTGHLEFHGGRFNDTDTVARKSIVRVFEDSFEYSFKEGYEEREELAEKGNQFVIQLAMNVAMADGSLADSEGNVIKDWIEKSIAPYSDSKKEHLKEIFNETLKTSYARISSNGLNLDAVLTNLKSIDSDKIKHDAITLCYQIMSADGQADKSELKVLQDITESLDLDPSEVERVRDKHLLKVNAPSATELSVESMLGISADWDKERIRTHLTSEFQKWNNRLTTLDDGPARDNAQHMLDKIAEARRTYGL